MLILNKISKFTIFILILCFALKSSAQTVNYYDKEPQPTITRILFVFDCSLSMVGKWQSDRKITIARNLLSEMLDSIMYVDNVQVALRMYGHQKKFPPQDCDDTKLEVPFGVDNAIGKIKHKLITTSPKGTTPIALSLEAAANDFPQCAHCRNIIVLITDGIEECNGDPCAVSQALQKKGIILKPFIIGIGKDFSAEFECVGTYFDATSEQEFRDALKIVISQALNTTSCQVNLLDIYGNPTETDVNMTFYDNFSGKIMHNFMHTLNTKGLPDTLFLDALLNYNIHIHTIPSVFIDSLKLTPGKHTVVGVNAPQGFLKLKIGTNPVSAKKLNCIVRQHNKMQTLNIQNFSEIEKYITGDYDLEILCLPRVYVDNVNIKQSYTTTVEIPTPGAAVFTMPAKGFASLYIEKDNRLEWVYNLQATGKQEILSLQPGYYRTVYRSKYLNHSIYTVEKSFEIESNKSTKINFSLY